ncbi:MAG: apolipoprotein N-acyltransferase [Desulfovibrio sp.]
MPLLCLLAVIGAFLGYPNPWLHLPPLMLLFPAALCLMAFRATSQWRALGWSYLTSVLALTACLYWVAGPVAQYGGLPWWLALPCPFGVSLVMGLYGGAFGWGMHRAARRFPPLLLCIFAGILWTALEQTGSWLFSGFPWVTLSVAFAPWPLFIQGASLVGAYGLSGLFVSIVAGLLLWNTARPPRHLALFLCIFLLGFGCYRMAGYAPSGLDKHVALIQGNIDQAEKWEAPFQIGTVQKYIDMSRESLIPTVPATGTTTASSNANQPDLIVWPETAMPFYLQDASVYSNQVSEFVRTSGVPLIAGAPAYMQQEDGSFNFYNRAFLFNPHDDSVSWYDKVHLVPFGEYVPLKEWLPVDKLASGVGDYLPGDRLAPLNADGMHLGLLICYEAIFPELAQERVARGADILVNISNDAWFGRSSAPWQHLAQTRMRAVEQSRWIARGTNTGVSAFIDPLGRLAASSELFQDQVLTWTVKPVQVTTIYHDAYHWLTSGAYLLAGLLFSLTLLCPALRRP